jgi:hypothetical protein
MAASFPSALKSFTQQVDGVSTMDAADVNAAYDEIQAMQAVMGISPTVNTTDATETVLHTIAIPANSIKIINGFVCGTRTGGVSGSPFDCAIYGVVVFVKNVGGTVSILDDATDSMYRDQEWTVTADISGTNILIHVTGASGNNITWQYFPAQYLG